jgi:hypothetical protein
MYSATFIFDKKQFDDDFYELDQAIANIAKKPQVIWEKKLGRTAESGMVSNVYYWHTMDGIHELMQHPKHLEAKAAYSKWLKGYQVVISQVVRAYGDGAITHPTTSFVNR